MADAIKTFDRKLNAPAAALAKIRPERMGGELERMAARKLRLRAAMARHSSVPPPIVP